VSEPEVGERGPPAGDPGRGGLCPGCVHVRRIVSDKGSTFLRCELSRDDPRFARYPPQPVRACPGHRPR
jgi:hypothetical protein